MFTNNKVPYRIETQRTVIRCWDPRDAMKLQEAINASVDSLLPWMPWAKEEPKEYRSKIPLLRRFRGDFDLDRDYVFGIFNPEESEVIGGCGLHTRAGAYALEVGYWINSRYQNQGYATESSRALIRAAFELSDVDNVQIQCAVDNAASLRVVEKVGFSIEGTLSHRVKDAEGRFVNLVVGTILREDYGQSGIKELSTRAFDATGELILGE